MPAKRQKPTGCEYVIARFSWGDMLCDRDGDWMVTVSDLPGKTRLCAEHADLVIDRVNQPADD